MVVIEVVGDRGREINLARLSRQVLGRMAKVRDRVQQMLPLQPLPLAAAWVRVRVRVKILDRVRAISLAPVSYTHSTLPTLYAV